MPKILIVDDDFAITELMKTLAIIGGHQPTTVNDSLKALEVAIDVNPDVITLDLMMPGLTGFELCELMHNDPKLGDIPIIIVSARDDPESKAGAYRAGARDYLTKPFETHEFIEKIKLFTENKSGEAVGFEE